MSIVNDIEKSESYEISDKDFHKVFGEDLNVIDERNLHLYHDLSSLFGTRDFCIILLRSSPKSDSGHWVTLRYSGSQISFFDPYGFDFSSLTHISSKNKIWIHLHTYSNFT